jgi:hypothetical protein
MWFSCIQLDRDMLPVWENDASFIGRPTGRHFDNGTQGIYDCRPSDSA